MSHILFQNPILWQFITLAFAIGYLSGSVPYGLVLSKLLGFGDIRKSGSGNIGATNALRVGGKKLGILTLACDMLKALIPVLIAKLYFNMDYAVAIAIGAFVGHVFPVWLKFKGGKGVAVGGGAILALSPLTGAIICVVWLLTAIVSKYSSLSAIVASASATLICGYVTEDIQITTVTAIVSVILLIKHHENIKRLLKGEESKINLNKKK